MLTINQVAPDFTLPNQDNKNIRLTDFRDKKNVVLYFYPKDDTPGCTIEANQFTALADAFQQQDAIVFGVSKDDCDSHRAFIGKYDLAVQLLADTQGEVCERYGVWQEKEKDGVKKMGIVRSTFIIDRQGVIREAMYGVSADGHAQAVLDKLQQV